MFPETWLGFITVCLLIEITPGPNMAYLMILSMGSGRRAGLATVAGITLGLLVVGIAAALGLAAVISSSPVLYGLLRWLGVAYLLWIAWSSWQVEVETSPARPDGQHHDGRFFRRGLLVNVLNPKAAVFYISILPQFISHPGGNVAGQILMLTVIYVGIATFVHVTIVLLAGSLQPLIDTPSRRLVVRRALALLLGGVAVWFGYAAGGQGN